jgi:hypothetical protein
MHVQPQGLRGGVALRVGDRDAAQQVVFLEDLRAGTGGGQERAREHDRGQYAIRRQATHHQAADLLCAQHNEPLSPTQPARHN